MLNKNLRTGVTMIIRSITRNVFVRSLTVILLLTFVTSCKQSSSKATSSVDDSVNDKLNASTKRLKEFLSHEVITKEMIENEDDSTLEDLIFSNIYVNIHAYSSEDYNCELQKFTNLQQAFYSTLLLERNFSEGRFYTYYSRFHNLSAYASRGYRLLGFPNLAKTVDEASSLFQTMLEKNSLEFAQLDSLFATQISLANTSGSRIRLVRENMDSFALNKKKTASGVY